MANDPLSPRAHGFQPFILAERYVDVVCDLEGYDGFSINVRMNLSNNERAALQTALTDRSAAFTEAYQKRQFELQEINSLVEKAKAENDAEAAERLAARQTELAGQFTELVGGMGRFSQEMIAPYVRRWNVYTTGPDGEPVEVPPPAVDGLASFDAIDGPMVDWMVKTVLEAYRGGKGLRPLQMSVAAKQGRGAGPSSDGPKGTPPPPSPPSRRNSRTPEA